MLSQYRILERHLNVHLVGEQDIDCANAATTSESCAIDGEITVGICNVSPKPCNQLPARPIQSAECRR